MTKYNLCPKCRQEIKLDDLKFMVAIDRPYYNIWFHRACYKSIPDIKTLNRILLRNKDLWYNIDRNSPKIRKKRK